MTVINLGLTAMDSTYSIYCLQRWITAKQTIPISCEIIDCCEGCPKSKVSLRFSFKSTEGVSLVLFFGQNDTEKDFYRDLNISGNIRRINNNKFLINPGESAISGFPVNSGILAGFQYKLSCKLVNKKNKPYSYSDKYSEDDATIYGSVHVWKEVGDFIIWENEYQSVFRPCGFKPTPPRSTDKIRLNSKTGSLPSGIVTDSRVPGPDCRQDQMFQAVTVANVGNYLSNDICNSETIVFSNENAMAMKAPSTEWTDAFGDIQPIDLMPVIHVRAVIWLMDNSYMGDASTDLRTANQILYNSQAGITIDAEYRVVPDQSRFLLEPFRCENIQQLITNRLYVDNVLNIYYSADVSDGGAPVPGICCFPNSHREVIGVSMLSKYPETLAHELGHAFSLDHTILLNLNIFPAGERVFLQDDNLMYRHFLFDRIYFTQGQCYRMNVNTSSVINVFNLRAGEIIRNCADNSINDSCMRLSLKF